jgi:hypothetical protein
MNILAPDSIPGTNKMSQGSLVEIAEHKSVPPKAGKRKRKFLFLAGAVVLIVLAVIGVEARSSRTEAVRQGSQQAAEVTVVHPQKDGRCRKGGFKTVPGQRNENIAYLHASKQARK